jgi:hypothetical protein
MAENESLDLGKTPSLADGLRYRQEWLDLAACGRTLGWPWADWLAPGKVAV